MSKRTITVGLALALPMLACAPSFDFAPWILEVPESTRVIGYRDADMWRADTAPIELVEELAFGGSGEDFDYLFGRFPPRIAVADDGRIYVLDRANRRVQVFDQDGIYRLTMGREGQGPEEFSQPLEIFIDRGELVVYDVVNRRVSQWGLDGGLVATRASGVWGGLIVPVAPGEMVWRAGERTQEGRDVMVRRVNSGGELLAEFLRMPWPLRVIDPPLTEIAYTEPDAWWAGMVPPAFAADPEGTVYISPFEEYQIYAFDLNGTMRWALQSDRERLPLARVEIDLHMANHARRYPDRVEAQIDWPELQYAIGDMKVDGHGHLYVFPYIAKGTLPEVPRPVDVFDSDGQHLYSGLLRGRLYETAFATYNGPMLEVAWQIARGDSVWGLAEAPGGDLQVVRYRLNESF